MRTLALVGATLLWLGIAQTGWAQSSILTGTFSASGTETNCSPTGAPTPWSLTGIVTLTLDPGLPSLVAKGGTVSGTGGGPATFIDCGVPTPISVALDVDGTVAPGGTLTLTITNPSICTFVGVGTINEISGAIPSSCFFSPHKNGTGTFALTAGVVQSTGPTVGPPALSFAFPAGSTNSTTQSIQVSKGGSTPETFSVVASGQSWLNVGPASGTVLGSTDVAVTVNPKGLPAGTYTGTVTIAPASGPQFPVSINVTVSAAPETLILSQTSLRFQASAGSPAPNQSLEVLSSGASSLPWSATASTLTGNWLSVTPANGVSGSSATVTADASNLEPGDYYGLIQFTAPGAANSPQTVVVVLNVSAATTAVPSTLPTALIFAWPQNGQLPAPQSVMVTNSSTESLNFTTAVISPQKGLISTASPRGSVNSGHSVQVAVSANDANLAAGVYIATLEIQFSNGVTQQVEVLVIVTPTVPGEIARRVHSARPASCTPTVLLPVSTELGQSFDAVAAWPVALLIQVVDDCGSPMREGSVVASFSSGDPSLALVSLGNGGWSGTWSPVNISADSSVVITIQAESAQPALSGTLVLAGAAQPNAATPQIFPAAVVSAASFDDNAPLAPGAFVSIFGKNLANSSILATSLPLTTELSGTQVEVAGRLAPIDYASDGQLNIVLPYDLAPNSTVQLIVLQGSAYSQPQSLTIASSQPTVFSQNQSGHGPGAIVVVTPDGTQFPADSSHPASAGDSLVIYCSGLGAVTPAVTAGSAAPVPAAKVATPITVTIGGKPAPVSFAGLTPTYAGLYQVNVTVPSGIAPGPSVAVVVTGAGLSSPPVTVGIK